MHNFSYLLKSKIWGVVTTIQFHSRHSSYPWPSLQLQCQSMESHTTCPWHSCYSLHGTWARDSTETPHLYLKTDRQTVCFVLDMWKRDLLLSGVLYWGIMSSNNIPSVSEGHWQLPCLCLVSFSLELDDMAYCWYDKGKNNHWTSHTVHAFRLLKSGKHFKSHFYQLNMLYVCMHSHCCDFQSFSWPVPSRGDRRGACTSPYAHYDPSCI